ncbi:Gfo/Idh/MocA family protein [Micropruina sp.]|uniref:Gfo/Idh/MocA family protein n=1 Tax=Micropruina sp. TaxID=2737536 RepID=UPI0039E4234F
MPTRVDLSRPLEDHQHRARPARIGLVGFGPHVRESILPAIAGTDLGTVVAAYAPLERDLAQSYPAIEFVGSLNRLVLYPGLDGVVVAATPQVNSEVLAECARHGMPMFFEKPLAVSSAVAKSFHELATRGSVIGVGHNFSFSPALRRAKQWIQSPDFGEPVALSINFLASKPRGDRWSLGDPRRSFLLSHLTHALDIVLFLLGLDIELVAGTVSEVEGIATAALLLSSGNCQVTLLAGNGAPRFALQGSTLGSSGARIGIDGLASVEFESSTATGRELRVWRPSTIHSPEWIAGYRDELSEFARVIRTPSESGILQDSLERAIRGLQLIDDVLGGT